MNKPLLSICIPTYNRAHYLKECLDSIVAQFNDSEVRDNVEVVVSDNASLDKTRELAEEYCRKFNNIKYFRNNENIGFDLNVANFGIIKLRDNAVKAFFQIMSPVISRYANT